MTIKTIRFEFDARMGYVYIRLGKRDWYFGP